MSHCGCVYAANGMFKMLPGSCSSISVKPEVQSALLLLVQEAVDSAPQASEGSNEASKQYPKCCMRSTAYVSTAA